MENNAYNVVSAAIQFSVKRVFTFVHSQQNEYTWHFLNLIILLKHNHKCLIINKYINVRSYYNAHEVSYNGIFKAHNSSASSLIKRIFKHD